MALPRDVQRTLDQMEPAIRRAFEEAIGRIVAAIVLRDLADAIERNDVEAALRALRLEREFFQPLDRAIEAAFYAGGVAALSTPIVSPTGERYLIGFDGRHPRAEAWAQANVGDRIVEIVADQRLMARDVIERQIVAGVNPRTAAMDIVGKVNRATGQREGGFIGLTRQQSSFVENMRADLAGLDERYFTRQRRDRRYDSLVRRAIADGRPLGQADVDRITGAYKRRLLAYRGETIARNESINALRAGRHEGYEQLVERTDIRADQMTVTWSATMDSRTRDAHRDMNGQTIPMGGLFTSPSGARLAYPGDSSNGAGPEDTIQCRCLATYSVAWIDR